MLYANEKNGRIAKDVLNLLAEKAQNAVKDGTWRSFKLILRFLACLQDVLEGEGVFPILDELFGQAVDLQTASSDDVRKNPLSTQISKTSSFIYISYGQKLT